MTFILQINFSDLVWYDFICQLNPHCTDVCISASKYLHVVNDGEMSKEKTWINILVKMDKKKSGGGKGRQQGALAELVKKTSTIVFALPEFSPQLTNAVQENDVSVLR